MTNSFIANRSGSELYIRDIAIELLKRGYKPVVYSPRLGELAQEIRAATVPVVDDLNLIGPTPDLIHGQHHLEMMTALTHFTDVPAIYFCHGWLPWEETPPAHPRILMYVALNEAVRDRLAYEHHIPKEKIVTLFNFVDLERFEARSPLPSVPRRGLIYSNQAAENNYVAKIREACSRQGITLDVVGRRNGNPTNKPETLLGDYDLIFARGRCALEGMAVGAAVICCDIEGLGLMITTENLGELRRHNFGVRLLNRPFDGDLLAAEIRRYDAADAMKVSRMIRSTADLSSAVTAIEELYVRVRTTWAAIDHPDSATEDSAVSDYLKWLSQYGPHRLAKDLRKMTAQYELVSAECSTLREQVEQLLTQCRVREEESARLQAQLENVTGHAE